MDTNQVLASAKLYSAHARPQICLFAKLSSHQAWRQVHQQQCVLSWFSGKPAIPSRGQLVQHHLGLSTVRSAESSMAGHRIFDATNPAASQKHCCKASTNSPFACASGAKLRAPCGWSCGGTLYWVPPNTSKQKQQTEVESETENHSWIGILAGKLDQVTQILGRILPAACWWCFPILLVGHRQCLQCLAGNHHRTGFRDIRSFPARALHLTFLLLFLGCLEINACWYGVQL